MRRHPRPCARLREPAHTQSAHPRTPAQWIGVPFIRAHVHGGVRRRSCAQAREDVCLHASRLHAVCPMSHVECRVPRVCMPRVCIACECVSAELMHMYMYLCRVHGAWWRMRKNNAQAHAHASAFAYARRVGAYAYVMCMPLLCNASARVALLRACCPRAMRITPAHMPTRVRAYTRTRMLAHAHTRVHANTRTPTPICNH